MKKVATYNERETPVARWRDRVERSSIHKVLTQDQTSITIFTLHLKHYEHVLGYTESCVYNICTTLQGWLSHTRPKALFTLHYLTCLHDLHHPKKAIYTIFTELRPAIIYVKALCWATKYQGVKSRTKRMSVVFGHGHGLMGDGRGGYRFIAVGMPFENFPWVDQEA